MSEICRVSQGEIREVPRVDRTLSFDPPLSNEEFEKMAMATTDFQLERTKEGAIRMMTPVSWQTTQANAQIIIQLGMWWQAHKRGAIADSSGGFVLPDTSNLSPDAAYVRQAKSAQVTVKEGRRFLHATPDFVIELMSPSDRLADARQKMEDWMRNGVELGWLIHPGGRQVFVYEAGRASRIEPGDTVRGSGPVEGFTLDLGYIWGSIYQLPAREIVAR